MVGHFSIPPTKHAAPKNEKLDLDILQPLEQLLGLGWVTFSISPTKHVTLLGLGLGTLALGLVLVMVRVMLRCTQDLTMIQVYFIQMDD